MLEHVALQQERFRTPGLRADGRGIAVGEQALIRFGTLSQVVGFFRAFSEEQSLDHILPTLKIFKVRSRIQGLELLISFANNGSHMLDRAAAIARLLRGEVYTGRAPHFVRYRDSASPFGYDVQRLVAVREGMVVYQSTGALQFQEEGEIGFRSLMLSLSLLRKRNDQGSGSLFVRVPPGLRNPVQRFLCERRIAASVARLERKASGRFDQGEVFFLFRVESFPQRLFALFDGLPGVELFHTRRTNVFVQRGFRHPFALESCRKAFEDDAMYFFSGDRDQVDHVEGEAVFVDIESLKAVDVQDPSLRPQHEAQLLQEGGRIPEGWSVEQARDTLHYPVHLIRRPGNLEGGAVALFLHTPQEMAWLKRIVYALPATALETYKMAVTDQGCVILNRQGVEMIPVGMPLREVFQNVFVPQGTLFSPALSYEQLQEHLGLSPGKSYFMPHGVKHAFSVEEAHLQPIASYMLADIDVVEGADVAPPVMGMSQAVEMVNRDIGYFALWGHNVRKTQLEEQGAGPTQPMRALPPGEGKG